MGVLRMAAIMLALTAPVAAARAGVQALPVLTLTLYPGDAIAPETVIDKKFKATAAGFAAYVTERRQLAGKHAKRTLVAGQPIPLSGVKERDVVRQGIAAQAVFASQGLVITTRLLPLRSASAGETVEARNPESGLIISAIAQADGTLSVGSP